MKAVIIGTGMMGRAIAYHMSKANSVSELLLLDTKREALAETREILMDGGTSVRTLQLGPHGDPSTVAGLVQKYDVVLSALPWGGHKALIDCFERGSPPLLGIARPNYQDVPELNRIAQSKGIMILNGCGLEPGITEILSGYLLDTFDRLDELHIRCGGIPITPTPPLGYKIVFGGQQLPFHRRETFEVRDGMLNLVPRFSGVEDVLIPSVGGLEAWHDGLMPWVAESLRLRGVRFVSQKTLRWPGFATTVTKLHELGLLSDDQVCIDGSLISPLRMVTSVLLPSMTFLPGDQDIVILSVEGIGESQGHSIIRAIDLIDHYDNVTGLSAMARTTGFTASLIAQYIVSSRRHQPGAFTLERFLTPTEVQHMLSALCTEGMFIESRSGERQSSSTMLGAL